MKTWVSSTKYPPGEHPFSIQNLPYGVFSYGGQLPRVGVAIGDYVCDLSVLHKAGLLDGLGFSSHIFSYSELNAFMELERAQWVSTRERLVSLLGEGQDDRLQGNAALRERALISLSDAQMHLPAKIGDYTDFYASRDHATNVGIMIRGKDNALQANWLHLPVGYHGRSSSVVISGTDVHRPNGQIQADKENPKKGSIYGPCRLLDFELEMGFFVGGKANSLGSAVTMAEAEDRLFGVVILNDWSARDLQTWEYVPLGPFTAKNFATSISPWIVTIEALKPFQTSGSEGPDGQLDPKPLPYITDSNYAHGSYDVRLEVAIRPKDESKASTVTVSNLRHMYWNAKQQLVHHSVSGCPMKAGDLLGTGTISGPSPESMGSMLELSWRGSKVIPLAESVTDKERKFLKDGDEVIMTGYAQGDGYRVGFGTCTGVVLPPTTTTSAVDADLPSAKRSKGSNDSLGGFGQFKLHSYWRSSCSWRVRIALALKNLSYEYIPVDLSKLVGKVDAHLPIDFVEVNPLEQVPVLEAQSLTDGSTISLTQSVAIMEFLDDISTASGNSSFSLMPAEPTLRAKIRQIVEVINSSIQPNQNLNLLTAIKTAEVQNMKTGEILTVDGKGFAIDRMTKGLTFVEALVAKHNPTGTKFAAGTSEPTMADCCLVPQMYNARRFGIDVDSLFPTLVKVDALCSSLPAFRAASADAQPDTKK